MIRKLLQPFYTFYVFVTFALSVLIVYPLFVLFGTRNTTSSRKIVYKIIRAWMQIWMLIIGMPVKVIGNYPKGERYIIVVNHISYLDTIAIFPAIPFYIRVLGKMEITKIPVIGFICGLATITVDRSSSHSRSSSVKQLIKILRKEGSIVIFPEGTFNIGKDVLKEFYDGAFRLAVNAQTPILPIIFPDTPDRWHFSAWWKLWPGTNRAIYLEPIDVRGFSIESIGELKETVYNKMAEELKKYPYNGSSKY